MSDIDRDLLRLLATSVGDELSTLISDVSEMRNSRASTAENISIEVFSVQARISAITVQAEDYLSTMQVSQNNASAQSNAEGVSYILTQVAGWVGKLLGVLKSLSSWLINILNTATLLKGWKISGQLGNTTFGLAQATLEVSFGT